MTNSLYALRWNGPGRTIVFFMACSSTGCLLAAMYGLCPMGVSTAAVFFPAMLGLGILGWHDRLRGDGRLYRGVWLGLAGGLLAAISYDVFRLPFVFAKPWHIDALVPAMNLFKVFPRFGAMILGQPVEQTVYSSTAHLLGWAYHFSNGMTFGVMYLALIGSPARTSWARGLLFAVGLELGMLFTPYPSVFTIPLTTCFVLATLAAHAVFGVILGRSVAWLSAHAGTLAADWRAAANNFFDFM